MKSYDLNETLKSMRDREEMGLPAGTKVTWQAGTGAWRPDWPVYSGIVLLDRPQNGLVAVAHWGNGWSTRIPRNAIVSYDTP